MEAVPLADELVRGVRHEGGAPAPAKGPAYLRGSGRCRWLPRRLRRRRARAVAATLHHIALAGTTCSAVGISAILEHYCSRLAALWPRAGAERRHGRSDGGGGGEAWSDAATLDDIVADSRRPPPPPGAEVTAAALRRTPLAPRVCTLVLDSDHAPRSSGDGRARAAGDGACAGGH
ncbi:hypothetical protein M885DRAFT_572244 [Pelagophyceae sp. CCMP2097]|nr:hypothetical protein M885DRAFT_572244 [Pelagophyceae sp. CCMP2097]